MKITEKQDDILNQLVCERLTSHECNKELISTFASHKGVALVNYLHTRAWCEDVEGSTAFYVVKNPEGVVLLFFSLKCGALFDPLDEDEVRTRLEAWNALLQKISTEGENKEDRLQIIERIRSDIGISEEQLREFLKQSAKSDSRMLEDVAGDKAREQNQRIVRVGATYPAVELAHFCVNDNAREYWRSCGIHRPMGEVLFWNI